MGTRTSLAVAGMLLSVGPAAAQTPAAGPPSTPSVTIGGVFYGQYQYFLRDNAGERYQNNLDVTRVYLTATARLAKGVGGRFTLENFRPTPTSGHEVRVKYGYAQLSPEGSALSFKLGQLQTPFIDHEEALWDYRAQGSVMMDRAGYLASADLGLTVDGSWNDNLITMSAGLFDGETYRVAPGDHHKDVAARLTVRLLPSDDSGRYGGLRLTGFGLLGEPDSGGTRQRWLGQVSYRSRAALLAGEFAVTRDRIGDAPLVPTTKGQAGSVFGWLRFGPAPWAVLARVDWVDPDTGIDRNGLTRYIAGVSYRVSPNLRLILDLDHLEYRGTPTPTQDAARSQALFQVDLVF